MAFYKTNVIITNNNQEVARDFESLTKGNTISSDDLFLSMLCKDSRSVGLRENTVESIDDGFDLLVNLSEDVRAEKLCEMIVCRFGESKVGEPRKRGRPRKNPSQTPTTPTPKKRGRPKKNTNSQ